MNCDQAIEWLGQAADGDDAEARFLLGYMHDIGYCVEWDEKRSVEYYELSAAQGNIDAMNNLGIIFFDKENYADRAIEAISLWEGAAEGGSAVAMRNLGSAYIEGSKVEKDPELAIEYYTKAAELSDLPAIFELSRIYREGDGVEINTEEESYWIERAAETGYADSMASMALRFYRGHGVPKSRLKAKMWADRYLETLGFPNVELSTKTLSVYLVLADLMATPGWVGYNPDEAIKLYRRITKRSMGEGNYELARHYQDGSLGEENRSQAFKLFMKVVRRYDSDYGLYGKCAYRIAMCYRDGVGTKANPKQWIEWLEKAAQSGNPFGAYDLALAYADGIEVEKDQNEALRLMTRASELRLTKAHIWLSEYYLENAPESDKAVTALKYLKGLAVDGNAKARSLLRKFNHDWREAPVDSQEEDDSPDDRFYEPIKAA